MAATLKSIEEQIVKDHGEVMISASALSATEGGRLRTTLALDIGLGGGIPRGSIVSFTGRQKLGKTTLCMDIITNFLEDFPDCEAYFLDAEHRLRSELLDCFKPRLDLSRLHVIRSIPEKILTAEDFLNIMLGLLTQKPGCLVVLDSIAMLFTGDALGAVVGEGRKVMDVPSLMYEALRRVAAIVSVNKSTLIAISHIQAAMAKGGHGRSWEEAGGNAIKYTSSVRLVTTWAENYPATAPFTGKDMKVKIDHTSLGPPGAEVAVPIRYGRGVDHCDDLISVAEQYGVMVKAGSWYSIAAEGFDPEQKWQGQANLSQFLKDNPDKAKALEASIRTMIWGGGKPSEPTAEPAPKKPKKAKE